MNTLPDIEERDGCLVYPLPVDARLDRFDRVDFYHRRYLRSDSYAYYLRERKETAGWYANNLWFSAMEECPVGTVPQDEGMLAHMLGLGADLKRWRAVAPDALRGHRPVMRPCGRLLTGRVAHPMALAVAVAGWGRDADYRRGAAGKARAKRASLFRKAARGAGISTERYDAQTVDACLAYIAARGLMIGRGESADALEAAREAHTAVLGGWSPEATNVLPLHAPAR